MPSTAWQQPFVNLCKHYGAGEWTKCSKEGEVSKIMDRTVKSSIFKIIGPIPSANYIQFPKPKGNPLNLIGHHLYVLFKPIDGKYFSIHLDVVTSDSIVIRISLSNIFKEFKSTSTWLQFPVFANPVQGSVDEATTLASNIPDNCLGGSPKSSRWTLLCLNMQYVLSVHLNKQFSHLKSIRLCSSMFLKNVFTSTTKYEPGLDISKARKTGLLASGVVPLPREMSFPLERHETWATKYDHILFPNIENKGLQLENAMPGRSSSKSISKSKSKGKAMVVKEENKERKTSNAQRSRVALAETVQRKLTENKKIASIRLPEVGLETPVTDDSLEISPKPSPDPKKIQQKKPSYHIYANKKPNKSKGKENQPIPITKGKEKQSSRRKVLNVDPILKLSQIIGFDGSTSTKVFWTKDGGNVVYPSHGCIVKYDVTTGRQQFMIGHNEEVTSLCLCETDNNILFSAQRGQNSIIRTWKVQSLKCINIFQTNIADIHCMSVSPNDEFLCVVGLDCHQKQVLAVWDVSSVVKGGAASLIAKVHTELRADTITCVKFIPNDNNRLMTCGKSNMRVWRLKPKQLKSCAIELGQYLDVVFTDMAFERRKKLVEDPTDFKIFVSSSAGKLFVVTYKSLTVTKVFDLSQGKQLSLNCIALSDNYCAVGCSDGYLRVWPISFQSVYLEAEHEGAVKIVSISEDGSKILAGTDMGNLGTIDILQKSYSTITRSHLSPIISTSLNPVHQQIASISEDRTIKLWDLDTFQQVYDFQSPNEALTSVSCHPNSPELACGFVTGAVRIFSLSTTTLKKELLQHPDTILSTAYSPNGQYLYSAGGDGALIQYNVSDDYDVLKMAENLVCKEPELPSYVLAIDSLGNRGAVIGASSYLITVFSAKTLDELLVIDISCTFKETNQKPTKSSKKNSKTLMDKPIGLIFSPSITGSELLVITMDSRLLKFNSKSGQILTEISNIHKGTPTSFCCCPRGYFIATAGDYCIKVWDYEMEESQVFIGHCSDVSSLAFTNDCRKLISSGEMIAVWDFIPFFKQDNSVNDREVPSQAFPEIQEHSPPGPQPLETSMLPREDQPMPRQPPQLIEQYSNAPPRSVPKPSTMTLLDESQHLENINQLEDDLIDFVIEEKDEKRENQEEDSDCEILCYNNVDKEQKSLHRSARLQHSAPKVLSHFQELRKRSELANKRYAAPTHQAGMRLTEIIGANGNARRNVIWEPDSGLFIYTEGCHLVSEDLANGRQEVFYNAVEEISTIALQYDGKFVAVGCAYNPMTKFGPIVIWDLANKRIEKTLEHHNCSIIGLQFSRDDRFLLSVSDYRECSITIWACQDYTVVCQATTDYPIHAAIWHPYNANEMVTVGRNATLLFWYLNDENYQEMKLEVSPAEFPKEVFRPGDENHDVTSLACSGKDQLLTGTSNGVICVWSIADRRCFMHWQADNTEICSLSGSCGHVLTGSASKNIRLWKLPNIESILTQADSTKSQKGVVMEREQTLDAPITSLVFDENLEMGLASTTNGSIWYINWSETEAECVRIISGHQTKINSLVSCVGNDDFVATACADGSLKLWAMDSRDQAAQFLVIGQECTCVTFCAEHVDNKNTKELLEYNQVVHPLKRYEEQPSQCLAGYQDGTVRMFDFGQMKMLLKTKPHSCRVTSIAASFDGRVGISGSDDGLLVISSLTTGMTVRVFNDHRGGALCRITQQQTQNSLSSSLWLASSSDCRISVWRSDWSKDICELNDWITFVRPSYSSDQGADNEAIPCLALFSPSNSDLLVYTGYTVQKEISFYSMIKRKVVKTVSISNWILALDISPCGNLLAAGTKDRLVKLIDCESGTFQDFVGHYEAVQHAKFVKSGKALVSSAHSELLKWDVLI